MRWVRYTADGETKYGRLDGDTLTQIAGAPWADATPTGKTHAYSAVKVEVPVIPRTFYCAGINYAAHIREMAHKRGVEPVFPAKADIGYRANNALIADGEDVVIPAHAPPKMNYEGELVVVIGKQDGKRFTGHRPTLAARGERRKCEGRPRSRSNSSDQNFSRTFACPHLGHGQVSSPGGRA